MGVLSGYKIVEFAGSGPAPMCAMLLSARGAEVRRLDRAEDASLGIHTESKYNLLGRGRRSVAIDLKRREGTELALKLIERADALHSIGRRGEAPVPPLNLVGDFGGGGVYLALGVVAGMLEAQKSGKGQVVDVAMIDGASSLMAAIYGLRGAGVWNDNRGENILDTGAHYYNVYETSDGKYVSIGSIEGKFYAELMRLTGLGGEKLPRQNDSRQWPAVHDR